MIELDPRTTALVLIDLQNGIVSRTLAPRSGAEVAGRAKELAQRFRAAGARVVLYQPPEILTPCTGDSQAQAVVIP